ncbi:TolC family protein [Arcobacter aquimarinus]|uniref:RND family efflux system, outer membrane channel protein, TolC family n=1 Tax=Arcobacter aquimarinus TaxID=1315211 RepID=A0AAE7E258_9BACT|nr:TolC family protein [Arcobacter aquimarinus]QKE26306.1 RND family efflux system, outer membrane channel protein, TolC family [Arcobacter aquimarinus]RXI35696.1 transporter [Arcobacter aquimarinus]
MLKKVSKGVVISVVASFVITGCAVKPEAILKEDVKQMVKNDLTILSEVVQPVTKPISLDEAIQRGLEHNLQKRVKVLESALSQQQLDLVYYDMLPSLTASSGLSERNNYAASASTSFVNGEPQPLGSNPSYSVSQEKERTTADLTFSWNILDFGLSYVRAQQQADKFLIAQEKQKKVEHSLTQEIRRAYYQAVSSQDLLKRIQPMMVEVKQALEDSKKMQEQRVAKTPMEALSYQRELLDILRSLHTLESSLISAKVELAELMGLKPGIAFDLADKVEKDYEIPTIDMNLEEMEILALENRPELAESRYQERISEKEITAAKLKMLPGINLSASLSYENSDYLLNNDWYSYGANVSWNLLNVFKATEMNKLAKTQVEVAKEQKLALSMAVLSQVHLSIVKFNQAKKEYLLAKEYLTVADDIYDLTKIENEVNVNSRLILIKEKLNNILATLRYSSSYANVQNSYGRIFASLGINENKNSITDKVEEVTTEEISFNQKEKVIVEDIKEENKIVAKEEIKEFSENIETPLKKEVKIKDSIFNKNFNNSKIKIYENERLLINDKEYIVKKDDDISKISKKQGVSIKQIVVENFWLVEKNRVEFK